jgi:hypothetical protein
LEKQTPHVQDCSLRSACRQPKCFTSKRLSGAHHFPPNQLEIPLLASLAFFSTVASNLSTPFISSLPVLSLYSLALASASASLAFASAVCYLVRYAGGWSSQATTYGRIDLRASLMGVLLSSLLCLFPPSRCEIDFLPHLSGCFRCIGCHHCQLAVASLLRNDFTLCHLLRDLRVSACTVQVVANTAGSGQADDWKNSSRHACCEVAELGARREGRGSGGEALNYEDYQRCC